VGSLGTACASFFCVIPITMMLIYANELNLVKSDATANMVQTAHLVHDCVPSNEDNGHLVFTRCAVQCPDISNELPSLLSPFFQSFAGTELAWFVEIYQWEETSSDDCHKNNDGSKTCHRTYSYSEGWQSRPINSNNFHNSYYSNRNYNGMTALPNNLQSGTADAPDHSVLLQSVGPSGGANSYALPNNLAQMFPSKSLSPGNPPDAGSSVWQGSGDLFKSMLRGDGSSLVTYSGSPSIGDLRIRVTGKTGTEASVAAKQVKLQVPMSVSSSGFIFSFKNYPPQPFDFWGRETYPIGRLQDHIESRKEFIKEWMDENFTTVLIFRIILLVVMIVAYKMLLQPLSVMADLLRIINCFTCGLGTLLDNAAQGIICAISCGLGCCVFLFVVAVSWLLVRPTLSVGLIALGAVMFFGLHALKAQQGKAANAREAEAEGYAKLGCTPQPHVKVDARKVQPMAHVV
jgi:hypothetical protein